EGLAGAEALSGNARRARRLLAVGARLRASVGAPLRAGERGDVERIAARVAAMSGGVGSVAADGVDHPVGAR
ncbi:hypothetical protein, partial [Saccharomonospora sp. NB11]|uniref:hypothetical protein n=1 Tax=Saccharomonospora sp. NB11 TaxID=1642298 RepID=UPI0018D00BB5